jgi:hypothetical protein
MSCSGGRLGDLRLNGDRHPLRRGPGVMPSNPLN